MKSAGTTKVLFAITDLRAGGAERILSYIANGLVKEGYDIYLICYFSDHFQKHYWIDGRIKFHFIKAFQNGVNSDQLRINEFQRVLELVSPDIVISFLDNMNLYAAQACRIMNIPHIACERNCPWKHPADPLWRRKRDAVFRTAPACVFQTDDQRMYFGPIRGKSFILPNPVILDTIPLPAEAQRLKWIVSVGRYIDQKNYPKLIHAFSLFFEKHGDYQLHCYGRDCGLKASLQEYIALHNLTDSVFLHNEQQNLHDMIKNADFYLMTSEYEGMPNALAEASALGLICVALNSEGGGVRQIIQNGVNGIILPLDADDKEIASILSFLVSHPEDCLRIRKKCLQASDSSSRNYLNEWEKIIHEVIMCHESK